MQARTDADAYLQHLRDHCDVWLDTPVYNSGLTAVEAVAARLPLVHLSNGLKVRQSRSFLSDNLLISQMFFGE